MAERGPTVIERMTCAFRKAWREIHRFPTDSDMSQVYATNVAMLAAVRELQLAMMERDGRCHRSVGEVISEHERRAGGRIE